MYSVLRCVCSYTCAHKYIVIIIIHDHIYTGSPSTYVTTITVCLHGQNGYCVLCTLVAIMS